MRNMDIKMKPEELNRLLDTVEREHGPYCAICGKAAFGDDRDLVHAWTPKEIHDVALREAAKMKGGAKVNYQACLRQIQLRLDLIRIIHKDCRHTKHIVEKRRIDGDTSVSVSTDELAVELALLDSTKMNLEAVMKTPADQLSPEQLNEFQRLYLSYEVMEWLKISIALTGKYSCARCAQGSCCMESIVEIRPNEVEYIASYLKMKPEDFLRDYTYLSENKPFLRAPCPFYRLGKKDSRWALCQIYPVRPLVCRIYPLTGLLTVRNIDGCQMARKIAVDLSKIDRGETILSEFEQRMLPYIKRVKETLKGMPEDAQALSDELEKIAKARLPETPIKVKDQRMVKSVKQVFTKLLDSK